MTDSDPKVDASGTTEVTEASAEPEKQVISWKTKAIYGLGNINASATSTIIGFFMQYFFLNVACIKPANLAIIFLVSRIWDGVNDPIVGYLSDRTNTRWGRRRPWILFGCIPYAILYVLLWYVPTGPEDQVGLVLYFCFVCCLCDTAMTAIDLPYGALAADITDDYHERTNINAWRFCFAVQSQVIASMLQGIIYAGMGGESSCSVAVSGWDKQEASCLSEDGAFTPGNAQQGFLYTSIILAGLVVIIPSFYFVWAIGPEKHANRVVSKSDNTMATVEAPGLVEGLRIALNNKAYVMVLMTYLLGWLVVQFIQNNLMLYMQYHIQAPDAFGLMIVLLLESAFFSIIGWNYVSSKYGKKITWYAGTTILSTTLLIMYFTPKGGLVMTYILCVTGGTGLGVVYLVPWSMLPDVVEVDEIKTGQRREGLYYGWMAFFQKLGLGIGLALSSGVLAANGYVNPLSSCGGDADALDTACWHDCEVTDYATEHSCLADGGAWQEQPPCAVDALRLLISILPCCLLLLSIIPVYYYPITEEKHKENVQEINRLSQIVAVEKDELAKLAELHNNRASVNSVATINSLELDLLGESSGNLPEVNT